MKPQLIIKLSSGVQFDWFSISRKQRREFMKKVPGLKAKIDAALAELDAEKDKNGAEF
jgi:hypothetical protein